MVRGPEAKIDGLDDRPVLAGKRPIGRNGQGKGQPREEVAGCARSERRNCCPSFSKTQAFYQARATGAALPVTACDDREGASPLSWRS